MFGEFFTWWGTQLLDLVPARLRQSAATRDTLVVDATAPGLLVLARRRRGVEQRLGQMRLDEAPPPALRAALNSRNNAEPVTLRLPTSAMLEREVILPLAAERDPEGVLTYEMERLTPFTAAEVYWSWSVAERDRSRARLVINLALIPRAAIEGLVGLLASLGGRPSVLEAPAGQAGAASRRIAVAHAPSGGASRLLSPRTLAAAAAALGLLVVASPFIRQSIELDTLRDRIDTMGPRVREADAIQRKINGAGAGNDAVAAETRRLGDAFAALAAVTDILPDDSYLTEFTMRERKMTLSGLSASAPKLISDLSTDPRIKNPAFTAPVTKSETNHMDVFTIRAEAAN